MKDELLPSDVKFLTDFSNCKNELLSYHGINICKRIKLTQKCYREAQAAVEKNLKGKSNFIHGTDKFLTEFNDLYLNNKEFRNGFLCCLIHTFVEKFLGNTNIKYAVGELNFSLALATGDNKNPMSLWLKILG